VPGEKAVLIWDGRCGFCKIWIDYWKQLTGDRVEYRTSQDAAPDYPQIDPKSFSKSVQLVRPDASVASGARAVFETLGMLKTYQSSRVFASISEAAYRTIAAHRDIAYQLTRFTFGRRIEPARFFVTQFIFLRALAVIYAVAFASLATQISGLIGKRGILSLNDYLTAVTQGVGAARFYMLPSIFWFGDWTSEGDRLLIGFCWAGVAAAVLLFFGRLERLMLVLLFAMYLSLCAAGQDFMGFQWDALLTEAGFLAIFLGRPRIVAWLFRWLTFRLYFLSGAVKLLSHDPSWRNLSALDFHYFTQPLPTVFAWYAAKLPRGFQHFSTFMVLAVELGFPFLIWMPRKIRHFAAWWMIGLQILILITGNYTFFNIMAIALCLFLFDDQSLRRFAPLAIREKLGNMSIEISRPMRAGAAALTAIIMLLGIGRLIETFTGDAPEPLKTFVRAGSAFQIVNSYGLFAVMTTSRTEIEVQGSDDGDNWKTYEFRYKPGDVKRAPRWVAPFQPRLDWQMWFAALGSFRQPQNRWFLGFMSRLLEGSGEVAGLLEKNPFPDHPPRYIRALAYDYTFSSAAERRESGAWWVRKPLGTYLPPVGFKQK
jgi:hypothetical protein